MTSEPDSPSTGRRRALAWLARGFLSLWGLGAVWVTLGFLKPPRGRRGLAERTLAAGPADALAVGQGRIVRHGTEPILVVRTGDEAFVGLSGVCTHLRCILRWDAERGLVDCPCHAGSFDVNGNVLSGPPPRALARYRVEVRSGELWVHL